MSDTTKADALRFAAEVLRNNSNLAMPNVSYEWLVAEADRLDREAADDADLEAAARIAKKAWLASNRYEEIARVLRDRYRPKPRTDQDAERIGRAAWKWVGDEGLGHLADDTMHNRAFGRFVLDLVDGGTE